MIDVSQIPVSLDLDKLVGIDYWFKIHLTELNNKKQIIDFLRMQLYEQASNKAKIEF